jgi:hypothetical protein
MLPSSREGKKRREAAPSTRATPEETHGDSLFDAVPGTPGIHVRRRLVCCGGGWGRVYDESIFQDFDWSSV